MREKVEAIGKNFGFHRSKFNPDFLEQTNAALCELYRIAGRIASEMRDNSAVSWDRDVKAMPASIPVHV